MAKGKKQEDPNKVAQRKAERVAFVQSHPNLAPEVARQRFYVQTRAAELEAAGKEVDRAALREKFQSGGVTREGFYTPADVNRFNAARDNGSSLADTKNTPVTPTTPVAPSATNVPTPVKPTTSSVKTPASSYQAPQTTTSLGQVVQPPTSYMGPRPSTPVRGGEPNRSAGPKATGTPARGGEPREPIFNQSGLTYTAPTTNPLEGREFTSTVNRINPQAPANPKALAQQKGARIVAAHQAQILKSNPMRAAEQARIDAGYVPAPYDWTNLYRTAAGGTVIAAEALGMRGGPLGGALAAGTAYNLTNRLGNLLEQKTGFGGVKGDPGFKGDTTAKGFAIVAGGSLAGSGIGALGAKVISKIPGIPSAIGKGWKAVQKWADDSPQVPTAPWKDAGVGSPGISTSVTPRTPWREGPITGGTTSPRRVSTPKIEAEVPKTTRIDIPGETKTESGIIIPSPSTRQRAGRTVLENETLDEMAATNYNAFDAVLNKKAAQEPASLADTKATTVADQLNEDGVVQLTPRQQAGKKSWETRRANQAKLAELNIEPKGTTVGPAKTEPIPSPEPVPAKGGLTVVEGNARAEAMRNHPAFKATLPEEPPALSVVKEEAAPSVAPAKRPPSQRANETDAAYAKRLKAWQVENEGEVFKAPAGFEQARGSISYQEKAMTRIESGMSRTNRSRTTAFIEDVGNGMSAQGYPVQMEGESVWDFNIRSSKWLRENGKATPVVPDNSYLAQGTPEPVSLGEAKAAEAATNIPPKPAGLKPNAAYDPETKTWRNRRLDKNTGEFVFTKQRVKFATEEERQAATAARELAKQERRKAARAAASAEIKTKAETIAASGGPNAEFGPFMFGGEPIGRSKVTLAPGELPDWAQANVSLTTPKPSEAESAWLNRVPTKEEEAYFRELGNAKKMSAGRRVVRGTREATPADIQEYVRRMKGIRGEEGITAGPDNVALTAGQQKLEKEIEQVLGTDALTAIKNIAVRGNTPPLTQNIRGLESLAEVKASSEPLINKVVVRQPTPSASGRLREQAAAFFNAQGKLKGVSGADRMRTWNRLTQSDWFRQLQEREPAFANFLREQNSNLTEAFNTRLSEDVARTLPKPKLRQAGWFGDKQMGPLEQKLAAQEFDQTLVDNGLGAYDLKGEELVTGVKPGKFSEGTTPAQRAEAASIEGRSQRFARLVEQVKAEDQAAFGDINYFNRGFERGQQLDPMVDPNVTKDYGIVDEKGFTNISQSEFNIARRELNQPFQATPSSLNEAKGAEFEAQRKAIVDLWKQNKITKAEMNQQLLEARTKAFEAPSTGLPANPFQQEFGTELPKDYVQVLPESYGNVWDPSTWTDEMGIKREGRWITPQEAADKQAAAAVKQESNKVKVEQAWQRRHKPVEGESWMENAKRRAIAEANKPKVTSNWAEEEARRVAAAEKRAARIKATEAPQGKTAEQIRFELKNPTPSAPKQKVYDDLSYLETLDPMARAMEEARLNAQDVLNEYESDALDWIYGD